MELKRKKWKISGQMSEDATTLRDDIHAAIHLVIHSHQLNCPTCNPSLDFWTENYWHTAYSVHTDFGFYLA